MRETVPDLSRCVILNFRSELVPKYEEHDPMGIVEIFTLHYLNPMGFYETHTWYEER